MEGDSELAPARIEDQRYQPGRRVVCSPFGPQELPPCNSCPKPYPLPTGLASHNKHNPAAPAAPAALTPDMPISAFIASARCSGSFGKSSPRRHAAFQSGYPVLRPREEPNALGGKKRERERERLSVFSFGIEKTPEAAGGLSVLGLFFSVPSSSPGVLRPAGGVDFQNVAGVRVEQGVRHGTPDGSHPTPDSSRRGHRRRRSRRTRRSRMKRRGTASASSFVPQRSWTQGFGTASLWRSQSVHGQCLPCLFSVPSIDSCMV